MPENNADAKAEEQEMAELVEERRRRGVCVVCGQPLEYLGKLLAGRDRHYAGEECGGSQE